MNRKRHRSTDDEKEINLNCGNNIKYIPVDVTGEILSRLSMKSMVRFTLVSKNWRDIITSPCFSSMHAKNKTFPTFYGTSLTYHPSRYEGHVIEVSENGDSVTTTTVQPRSSVCEPESSIHVVGSCNGLLCLLQHRVGFEVISILNPITNESTTITLPNHDYWIGRSNKGEYSVVYEYHRFGYSPSTDEYKVLKVLCLYRGEVCCHSYAIFTVGVDERWRKLSSSLFPDTTMHCWPVLCHGAFHWIVHRYQDDEPCHILALDIARENTRRISIPPRRDQRYLILSAFSNRLCLSRTSREPLYVKEDYRDDSWSQIVVLPRHFFVSFDTETDSRLRDRRCVHLHLCCPKQKRYMAIRVPDDVGNVFEFTPTFSSIDEIIYGSKSSNSSYCLR